MRLIHIDKKGCNHITKLMPGISAVYQMEQEFFPYLAIEFVRNKGKQDEGVLLQTKHGEFRKSYTFNDPRDVDDLRAFIWEHLKKDYNIKDITNNGCLTSFSRMGTNKVFQDWYPTLRHKYTSFFDMPSSGSEKNQLKGIKHQVYNLNPKSEINYDICMKIQNKICDQRFKGEQNNTCRIENEYYCGNKYLELKKETGKKIEGFCCTTGRKNNILENIALFLLLCIMMRQLI